MLPVLFFVVFITSALKTCNVDLLLKIGTLLPEISAHETSVDYFIELLRKDQLDETISLDLLEKSISYFQVRNPKSSGKNIGFSFLRKYYKV